MIRDLKTGNKPKVRTISPLRALEAIVVLCGIFLFGYAFVIGSAGKTVNGNDPGPEDVPVETQEVDYSRFGHANQGHARLPCLICHRRDDNSSRITFPGKIGHLPCAGCHTVQFADNKSPICSICHTATGMKGFPALQSFGVRFDHARHNGVNCATCHKSTGRGAARSIPSGPAAHTTCFACHTANAASEMASCSTCHQPGRLVRTSEWSVAYRKSFDHSEHLTGRAANCATCHTVRPGAPRGRQMSSPLVSMHFAAPQSQSCGGCHNGKRAFGPDDFKNCAKCHNPKTFKF